jgi:hypothetical protein
MSDDGIYEHAPMYSPEEAEAEAAEADAQQLADRVEQKYQSIVQNLGDDDATETQLALMMFKKALETFKLKSMSRSDSFYGSDSHEKSTYGDHIAQRAKVLRDLLELNIEVSEDENLLADQKKELADKLTKIVMYVHYLGLATQYIEVAHQIRSGKMGDVDRSIRERMLKEVPDVFTFLPANYPRTERKIDEGLKQVMRELSKYELRHMGGKLWGKHYIEDYCGECKECGRYYEEHPVPGVGCEMFVPLVDKRWSYTWKTVNDLPYLLLGNWELVKEGDEAERTLEASNMLPDIENILKKLFCDNKNASTFYIFSQMKNPYKDLAKRITEHLESPQLPPLRVRKDCFSMLNGVLETKADVEFDIDADGIGTGYARFTPFDEATKYTKQCVKFLPNCYFLKAWAIDFNTGQGVTSDLGTPFFDKILLDQGYSLDEIRWVMIIFGRALAMQAPKYVNDRWDLAAIFHGHAGTGKSLLIDVIKELFSKNSVAVLSANGSKGFALECIIGKDGTTKDLLVCTEFSNEVKVGIQNLKSLIVGEPVNVNRKHKTEVTTRGQIPLILACNAIPDMENQEGQMERRLLIFDFKRRVKKVNTALLESIKGELHKLLLKFTANYHWAIRELGTTPPLRSPLLPQRFRNNVRDLRKKNPLDSFLRAPRVTKDPGNYFRPPVDFENVEEYRLPELVRGPKRYMRASDLFGLYRKWGCDARRGDAVKKKVKHFDPTTDDNLIRTTFNGFNLRRVRKKMLWFDDLGQVATQTKRPEVWVLGIGFKTYQDPEKDEDPPTIEHFDFDIFYTQHGSLKDIIDVAEHETIADDIGDERVLDRVSVRVKHNPEALGPRDDIALEDIDAQKRKWCKLDSNPEAQGASHDIALEDIDFALKRKWSKMIEDGAVIEIRISGATKPAKRFKLVK